MKARDWYTKSIKPSWAPPSWVFGPVWFILYIVILVSYGAMFRMLWNGVISPIIALPFILNIIFNLAFTPLQFGLKNSLFATIDILLVFSTLVWASIAIFPYATWIAYAQIPYLLWVSFATVLHLRIIGYGLQDTHYG